MKKYFVIFSLHFQQLSSYRGDLLIYTITNSLTPVISLIIWSAASASNTLLFTQHEIISYFLLTIWVNNFVLAWNAYFIGFDITSGRFSTYLIKPLSLLELCLINNISEKTYKMLIASVMVLMLHFFMLGQINLISDPILIVIGAISLLVALFINVLISIILGLSVFWTNDVDFMRYFFGTVSGILSGLTIPLALMPQFIQTISLYLPFRYMVSFPVELLLGQLNPTQILQGILFQIFWVVVLYFLYRKLFQSGARIFQGYGG
jgi:ABC-2 type transport system permease protein